jgi:hypothetical protein
MGGTAPPPAAPDPRLTPRHSALRPMPCCRRGRGILDHGAVLRLLDAPRHSGSLRPLDNHARPDRLLARAFADSCVLLVNLLEKQGD